MHFRNCKQGGAGTMPPERMSLPYNLCCLQLCVFLACQQYQRCAENQNSIQICFINQCEPSLHFIICHIHKYSNKAAFVPQYVLIFDSIDFYCMTAYIVHVRLLHGLISQKQLNLRLCNFQFFSPYSSSIPVVFAG